MPTFQFRLETLLKLRVAERQRRMSELAEALRAEGALRERHQQLALQQAAAKEQLRLASSPGAVDVDCLLGTHRHALVLETQRQLLDRQTQELQEEIQRRQGALGEADRHVQVLEKLRQRQWQMHCHEELRQEQFLLDEIAQRPRERGAP